MFSSKCGRLLVAAGVPVAAVGLTLVAGGTAAAAPVATPLVHAVKIHAEVPDTAHPAMVAVQTHLPEHSVPCAMPALEPVHPVVVPAAPGTTHARPGDRPVMAVASATAKEDGAKPHVFHQIVIIKIETTAITFPSH